CEFHSLDITSSTALALLSLHDALPICIQQRHGAALAQLRAHGMGGVANDAQPALAPTVQNHVSIGGLKQIRGGRQPCQQWFEIRDRKSTRLNSSHVKISYAVFCLIKKT